MQAAALAQQPGQAATAQVQQVQGSAAPQVPAQAQAQQPPMILQADGAGDTSSEDDEDDEEEEYGEDEEEEKDKDGGEDGQVEEVSSRGNHNGEASVELVYVTMCCYFL